jgi:hypothetical protein
VHPCPSVSIRGSVVILAVIDQFCTDGRPGQCQYIGEEFDKRHAP